MNRDAINVRSTVLSIHILRLLLRRTILLSFTKFSLAVVVLYVSRTVLAVSSSAIIALSLICMDSCVLNS